MATSSYANLFGTTGAGQQGSQAGISTLFGQQATARADDDEEQRRKQQQAGQAPAQTFAQMQAAGQARPAPPQPVQPQQQMLQQQQQQMLMQARQTATPQTQALMAQASQLGMDPNAVMMNPTGFQQFMAQREAEQASATGMGQMTPMGEIPRTRTMPTGTPFAMPAIPAMPGATPAGAGMPGTPSAPQPPAGAPAAPQPQPMPQNLQQMAFEQMRQASRSDLESQFASQRQALEEDLARRGLAASTIGAAGIGRLGGEQARALSQLDAQLLQQQANQAFEAQQAAEQRAFAGGESALERALRQQMQAAGFGQEADILSRQQQFMGGESAADRAARERLQLLGYGQEAEMLRRQQEFAGGESELERMLRERLQTGAQTFESGQSALERALRERLQGQQIGESQADRALRERMGLAELTGTLGGQETMASRQFGFQQQLANQQLAMELARIFSASDNPQAATQLAPILQQLLSRLPGYQAPAATPTSGGASAGAAGTGSATTSAPSLDQLLATLGGSNYDPYAGMPFEGAL